MSQKNIKYNSEGPFHVTARCNNKEWFSLPLSEVWVIMENYLYLVRHGYNLKIHSFVLMNNHFHMLVSSPEGNLSAAMNYFMRETSREIGRLTGRINKVYGGRFFRSHLSTYIYFMNAYKYVYRNPVRAAICKRAEDYKFSTLNGLLGMGKLIIPLELDTILFCPSFSEEALNWINLCSSKDDEELVRKALRKTEFSFPREEKTRSRNKLTYNPY